ncbi:MAG: hypothetical protein KF822_12510 [Steroidobacteraceae bacterium]|nr:hypothetical protein [Steroidobacteraceae bacterium]
MDTLPHEIVTVVGRTGSGKTQLIARLIGPRHPRRITLDMVGECRKLYPRAVRVTDLAALVMLLRKLHEHNVSEWHVVASLSLADIGALLRLLAPAGEGAEYSLSAAFGGVTLEIFELDVIAPVDRSERETREAVRNAYARGRHYGLSILAATQRPHQMDRIASSQSSYVVTFQMHEPADLRWLEKVGGKRFAEIARSGLKDYQSAWYAVRSGTVMLLHADYKTWETVK